MHLTPTVTSSLPLEESFASTEHNLAWKELLTHRTFIRFTVRSLLEESKKNSRLYLLDWALPSILAKRLHISNHLVLGVYNPLSPENTSLIQTVTHARCHFAMKVIERPRPFKDPNTIPWALPNSLYCHVLSHTFHSLINRIMLVFELTPLFLFLFFTRIYVSNYNMNFVNNVFLLCRSAQIQETWISDWGLACAKDGGNVTKESTKTKSFNTNNQKWKKKQVQTNKRTLIF